MQVNNSDLPAPYDEVHEDHDDEGGHVDVDDAAAPEHRGVQGLHQARVHRDLRVQGLHHQVGRQPETCHRLNCRGCHQQYHQKIFGHCAKNI